MATEHVFAVNFWGWGTTDKRFSGIRGPTSSNLSRTEGDHSYTTSLFQRSNILLHFQYASGSKLSDVENDAK